MKKMKSLINKHMSFFNIIPNELILKIISFLDAYTYCKLTETCVRFSNISDENQYEMKKEDYYYELRNENGFLRYFKNEVWHDIAFPISSKIKIDICNGLINVYTYDMNMHQVYQVRRYDILLKQFDDYRGYWFTEKTMIIDLDHINYAIISDDIQYKKLTMKNIHGFRGENLYIIGEKICILE